jgi:hypothetical protein
MKRHLIILLAAGALLLPGAARAEWLKASSTHFVVYADDSERDIAKFSEQLERYHSAMAFVSNARDEVPSPSNRVTIYVVSGDREVKKLYGSGSAYVGGFYVPRAGGSLAIVPRITPATTKLGWSMIVLLHEYAHHFMISDSSFPMPRWYSEGGAEFFASASFERDGTVSIGRPAMHRAAELLMPGFARDVKVAELLDPPASEGRPNGGYDAFYGKSWLLFHYLTFSEERRGQLQRYLDLIGQGKSSRDAGTEAFGDFGKLDRDLSAYLSKRRMTALSLRPEMLKTGPVEVSRLSAGEAAMMPVRIRSRIGVDEEEAKALLGDARAVAARFPDDPAVLAALAEAEHDAGNDAEAIAAADAALTKDTSQVNAYVQKGLSLFRLAASEADQAATYRRAMAPFVALNRIENDHPLPLIYNYRAFVEQGKTPDKLALDGLAVAVALAPFDLGLRMTLAMEQVQRRQFGPAKRTLAPVAYNPHGGELAAAAQRVITRMEADPAWDGRDFTTVAAASADEEVASSQ